MRCLFLCFLAVFEFVWGIRLSVVRGSAVLGKFMLGVWILVVLSRKCWGVSSFRVGDAEETRSKEGFVKVRKFVSKSFQVSWRTQVYYRKK